MNKNAVLYKGIYLMPGSEAFTLHKEGKTEQLNALLRKCDQDKRKLEGR